MLGIDPGSRITGYGLIEANGNQVRYIASGCIRMKSEELSERLHTIYQGVDTLIQQYIPQQMAIEQVFMARNPDSALKLGQARGVAIVCGVNNGLPVSEYSARQVKQAVVGTGAAKKEQVQHMVMSLLNLPGLPQADAADALAIALTHAYREAGLIKMAGAKHYKRGRIS